MDLSVSQNLTHDDVLKMLNYHGELRITVVDIPTMRLFPQGGS
jgi:hypothetical protein